MAVAATGLLAAGVVVLGYFLHWFGGGTVAPPPANPPQGPPQVVADKTGGKSPDPVGAGGTPSPSPRHGHKERYFWRSSKGTFDNADGENWIETYEGTEFHYVERERTEKFIELFDASRNYYVRLHADHYDVKVNQEFKRKLDGHWETPDG